MKKALLLFLMLQLTLTQAQNINNQNMSKWSIGARAGFSLLPDVEDQLQKNYKLGINAGGNISYKCNKYLTIKTEVNYTQKGKSYMFEKKESLFTNFNFILASIIDTSIINSAQGFVDDGVYSTYKGYHKLSYVELPLLAEVNFYKFKITAGPYVSILVNAYTKESLDQNIPLLDLINPTLNSSGFSGFLFNGLINNTFPGYKETFTSESTSTTNFTQVNYGFILYLSYQIHSNTFLEARYSRGLNSYLIDTNDNIPLSSFTLSLAYNFALKKLKQ